MDEDKKQVEPEKKQKKKILKKWWFWACVSFTILIIIAITIILIKTNNKNNIQKISDEISTELEGASLFYSKNNKTLVLELNNIDITKQSSNYSNVIKIIKDNLNNELKNFTKLKIITFPPNDDSETDYKNNLVFIAIYELPSFRELSNDHYINFEAYTSMYNTLDETMKNYTDLFMSIGR